MPSGLNHNNVTFRLFLVVNCRLCCYVRVVHIVQSELFICVNSTIHYFSQFKEPVTQNTLTNNSPLLCKRGLLHRNYLIYHKVLLLQLILVNSAIILKCCVGTLTQTLVTCCQEQPCL